MAHREWGAICPEDQGLLIQRDDWTKRGVVWCPNENQHGGNGRFWRVQEVTEGWYDPSKVGTPTEAQIERQARADQSRDEAEAARASKNTRQKESRRTMATDATEITKPRKAKDPQNCTCGCGGQTKGGRFIPGHDARYHARMRTLENEPHNLDHEAASKIASAGPLTGKYAVQPKPAKVAVEKPPRAARVAKQKPVDLTSRASDDTEETDEDIAIG